ncbi:MAG: HD domain-containing protein, partial [Verrucomicrobiales bacterium]|nr:HD domain-containing protein [Verrucomicrobiales bacterium]
TFSTPEDDAQRRDFTINGLFFDPLENQVIDHVAGQRDLADKTLRAIGDPDQRFAEDHLRLLRAVRFASSLGFGIEPRTWDAVRTHAPHIAKIAPERIRLELELILVHPSRLRGFDLLVDSGLMAHIWPEVLTLQGCQQPPQWHPEGDVFVHTRIMLGMLPADASLTLVLSVLFHDIAKPATYSYDPAEDRIRFNGHDRLGAEMAADILRRHRFSNDVIDTTVHAVDRHMQFMNVQNMRTAKLKRFMAAPHFDEELELHRVDCASSNGFDDNYKFLQAKAEEFANQPLIPPPFVTGKDLIDRGHQPGPAFKSILTDLQNLQLDGTLTTRDDALAHLDANFPAAS